MSLLILTSTLLSILWEAMLFIQCRQEENLSFMLTMRRSGIVKKSTSMERSGNGFPERLKVLPTALWWTISYLSRKIAQQLTCRTLSATPNKRSLKLHHGVWFSVLRLYWWGIDVPHWRVCWVTRRLYSTKVWRGSDTQIVSCYPAVHGWGKEGMTKQSTVTLQVDGKVVKISHTSWTRRYNPRNRRWRWNGITQC